MDAPIRLGSSRGVGFQQHMKEHDSSLFRGVNNLDWGARQYELRCQIFRRVLAPGEVEGTQANRRLIIGAIFPSGEVKPGKGRSPNNLIHHLPTALC